MLDSTAPLTDSFVVIDDFLPLDIAEAMRADVERHFATPSAHQPNTHQVWNYWFVPGLYTYLRTTPEKVIQNSRVDYFMSALRDWSTATLGLGKVTRPYLSLYVSGCSQGLHNDSKNGRFAFVYSLTRMERRTIGGETLIFREGDPFRQNLRSSKAGIGFYDLIEPLFNRLVVFDDRLVHGVQLVCGSMDPSEARCVLHGHIEESGPIINGCLTIEELRDGICIAVDRFLTEWTAAVRLYHGPLVLRFAVLPNGTVAKIRVVLDRVRHDQQGGIEWKPLRNMLVDALSRATFPIAKGETTVTLPITFGEST
jgi:hypothetical protein